MELPQEVIDELPAYRDAIAMTRFALHGQRDEASCLLGPRDASQLRGLAWALSILAASSLREAFDGRDDLTEHYLDEFTTEFARY